MAHNGRRAFIETESNETEYYIVLVKIALQTSNAELLSLSKPESSNVKILLPADHFHVHHVPAYTSTFLG